MAENARISFKIPFCRVFSYFLVSCRICGLVIAYFLLDFPSKRGKFADYFSDLLQSNVQQAAVWSAGVKGVIKLIVTQTIHMDLTHMAQIPQIHAVQGDTCSRCVAVKLSTSGMPWNPPEAATAAVRYRKADGTGGHYASLPDGTAACAIHENCVSVMLAPQMLTVPGKVITQVELVCRGNILATFAMEILVEKNPALGLIHSQNYVNWAQRVEDRLSTALRDAQNSGAFNGKDGIDGKNGKDGKDGKDGTDGKDGAIGPIGVTPKLTIGTVTTLPFGSMAQATLTGTAEEPVLNLALPRGYDIAEESREYPGCYYRLVGDVKEWLNPPAVMGVEYRTAERWQDHIVYTMVVNLGAASNGKTVTHGAGAKEIIRAAGKLANIPMPVYFGENFNASISVALDIIHIYETGYDAVLSTAQLWYIK